jgi:hypothetical protein
MAENPHNLVLGNVLIDQTSLNKLKEEEKFEDKVLIENEEYSNLIRMERAMRMLFDKSQYPFPGSSHSLIDRKLYEHLKAMQSFMEKFEDILFKDYPSI